MRQFTIIILSFSLAFCNSKKHKIDNQLMKTEFITLKSELPTKEWRKEMEEDLKDEDLTPDEIKFNEDILKTADSILNKFLLDMNNLDKTNVTEEIVKREIKKVVLALNDYDKTKPFIDTGQREDLCEFIDKAIAATGYKLPETEDYTLEWREW